MRRTLWAYAVAFDDSITRRSLTDALDDIDEVKTWYACMPNLVFVVSSLPAMPLTDRIRRLTGVSRIYVADADTDRAGYLPKKAWELLDDPDNAADE